MNSGMDNVRFDTHDKLNRKNQAVQISRVLKNSESYSRPGEGLVVALNSSWGTGKTMFLKMWENEILNSIQKDGEEEFPLKADNTNTLYYNAWEHDDYDNAFIPIAAHLNKVFKKTLVRENLKEETIKELASTLKKWTKTASKLAFAVGKNIAKKKLGLDKIDLDIGELLNFKQSDFDEYIKLDDELENLSFDEIEEKLGQLSAKAKEKYQKIKAAVEPELFEDFENFKRIKDDFRDALGTISKDKKLVVFVDELDRCRPLYAIETLEAIKHFFSVSNVVFVMSVDIEQLSHSIATVYGQNMDAVGYLMRFIDLQFRIPEPNINNFCDFLNKNKTFYPKQLEILEIFFCILKLSLREIEKIFKNLEILFNMIDNSFKTENQKFGFYSLLLIFKYTHSKDYEKLLIGKYTLDDLIRPKESFLFLIKEISDDEKIMKIYSNSGILSPLLRGAGPMETKKLANNQSNRNKYNLDYFLGSDYNSGETISQYIQRQLEMADI
jgi:predicted KAP-like P-loop ATPase